MASTTTEQLGEQQPAKPAEATETAKPAEATEATETAKPAEATETAKPAEATETAMVLAPPAAGGTGTVTTMTEHGAVDPNMFMLANIIAASQERIALDAAARDDKRERDAEERQKTLLDALERSTEITNERFVEVEHDTKIQIEHLAAIVEMHKDPKAADPYDAFFRTAEDRKMMEIVPTLCDGQKGIAAYMPVEHEGAMYVVVSVGIMDDLMQAYVHGSTSKVDMLRANFEKVTLSVGMFRSMMLKTPFKPYKKGPKMKESNWLKNNSAMYMIVKGAWFEELLNEIHRRCDVPDELPESVESAKLHMSQSFSIQTHYSVGRNVYESMGPNFELDDSQLASMPAERFPWTIEAYHMGCVDFFGMTEVDGKLGVIMAGKFREPHTDVVDTVEREIYARPYELLKAGVRKHLWGNFDIDVIEASPQLFPEQAMKSVRKTRKSSSGKRKNDETS